MELEYWQEFYGNREEQKRLAIPSQFAAFVSNEMSSFSDKYIILELGCGSGRDAGLLSKHFAKYVGVDQSKEALERASYLNNAAMQSKQNIDFIDLDLELQSSVDALISLLEEKKMPIMLYTRFFLHAVDPSVEKMIMDLSSKLNCAWSAHEFRILGDEANPKVTGAHYRRYLDFERFKATAKDYGWHVLYDVSGYGFAKYGDDDALVGRLILKHDEHS